MNWQTPIRYLPFVGPAYAKRLEKLEIFTVGDLLFHIPSRYVDYSRLLTLNQIHEGDVGTVMVQIEQIKNIYTRSRYQLQKAVASDPTGILEITWFNQPFIVKALFPSSQVAISGTFSRVGNQVTISTPDYELVRPGKELLHTGRLVPIYPETAGVSSKWLRSRIAPLLTSELATEYIPNTILQNLELLAFDQALHSIHFPKSLDTTQARHRLAFDELFILQLRSQLRRQVWQSGNKTTALKIPDAKLKDFISQLPFTLTISQKRSLTEIVADLALTKPMNRLLEGDVGSGKTVVAAIAAYIAKLNNRQTLFMAPTEILAQQHLQTLKQFLSPYDVKVGLITGSQKTAQKDDDVIVGTHALIQKNATWNKVGLIVIDEQHRFGVAQRALLREKAVTPHVLTMTATPIPRTLALALHGDLDLSVIDELPKNRKIVKTWVVPKQKRSAAYQWIVKQITDSKSNHPAQAFIVCPFIETSETLQSVKAARSEYENLSKNVFPKLRLGLLHGKMKPKEKQAILDAFAQKKLDLLVATPVVEVGIDIPAATIILIEGAERYGLAQLHQLRGRVGRSDQQSYCLLFSSEGSSESLHRLKYLETLHTGLKLAEIDLKIRGPGQLYGSLQHGEQQLKIAAYADLELVQTARQSATKLLQADPHLNSASILKERVRSDTIAKVVPD